MKYLRLIIAISTLVFAPFNAYADQLSRVVVAGGGITEIVYQLNAQDVLAGVDSTSQYPAAAQQLPSVGYLRALSAEGVLSLKPDAVLVTKEAGPAKVLEVLEKAGVNVQTLNSDYSIEGLLARVKEVATLLDKAEEGEKLAQNLNEQYKTLQTLLKQRVGEPKKVLFLLTHGGRSPMASGKGTAADALIKLAGAENVVGDFHGYRPLSQEAVASLKPDYILTTQQGLEQIGGAGDLLNRAGINLTPAAQKQQLIAMDALYLLGFGPRVIGAAQELTEQLYSPVLVSK